ncbi:MAG: hypothetical protein DMG64_15020 [Acidobacteria bacterium]|nr:MAG: hypothetical protein DMG64_15020 [Acidobacteriota bacterium]
MSQRRLESKVQAGASVLLDSLGEGDESSAFAAFPLDFYHNLSTFMPTLAKQWVVSAIMY